MEEDMEHRWHPRKEINSPVMVYQQRIGIVRAAVRNLSEHGMLVDMGRLALTKGAVVAVASTPFHRFRGEMFRLRALIAHADAGVAGLMFIGGGHPVAGLRKDLEDNDGGAIYLPTGRMNGTFDSDGPIPVAAYATQ
jgi:hypothetical protein